VASSGRRHQPTDTALHVSPDGLATAGQVSPSSAPPAPGGSPPAPGGSSPCQFDILLVNSDAPGGSLALNGFSLHPVPPASISPLLARTHEGVEAVAGAAGGAAGAGRAHAAGLEKARGGLDKLLGQANSPTPLFQQVSRAGRADDGAFRRRLPTAPSGSRAPPLTPPF
jgi:hypothetical protein